MTLNTTSLVRPLFSDYVKDLKTYIMFRIKDKMLSLKPELDKKNRSPLNLSIGAPTQPPPEVVIESLKKFLSEPQISMYSTSTGEPFFLDAVAQRMKKRFDLEINPKTQVCTLIGSKEGLVNFFKAFINPELKVKDQDIIMVPDPGYASYQESIRTIGGFPYPIELTPENNYMPDPEEVLQKLISEGYDKNKVKVFVLNYPSNPVGATADLEYYKKVIDFGLKHNIVICSDAAYVEMSFGSEAAPSILQVKGAMDIAIEFHSLSKPYSMTGWRIGFAVGNPDLVDILAKVKSTCDSGVFKAIQKAGVTALTDPACDEYIKENNVNLQRKQKLMVEGFKKLGWPIDESKIPQATFYLWLPVPDRFQSGEEFTDALLEKSGVVAVPGCAFGVCADKFFRISLVLPEDQLMAVIDRMIEDGFTYN